MKTKYIIVIITTAIALTSCAGLTGLTFAVNPDGSIGGTYTPPKSTVPTK